LLAVNERVAVRVGTGGATLRGRQIGVRLRELRDAAGLTGEEVARRMARAHSTLSRWETGGLIPRPADVFFMLDLYGVDAAEREALLRAVRDAREREDWEVDLSVAVADYAWMEGRAWKVERSRTAPCLECFRRPTTRARCCAPGTRPPRRSGSSARSRRGSRASGG
jgi:transcriptional regulator with XRE-family HTH domain